MLFARTRTLADVLLACIAGLWLATPDTFAADEICAACGQQVSVSGEFAHRKDDASVAIEGAANNAAAFREEINGKNFTVTIAHLPAGKYTIVIGEAETLAGAPGERVVRRDFRRCHAGDEISTSSPPPAARGKFVTSPAWSSMRMIRFKGR